MMSTVLAIDPGYDRCGWAILSGQQVVEYGCVLTDKQSDFFQRLSLLLQTLTDFIAQHHPTELAIETLFFSKNAKTAMRVAEVRGAITGLCLLHKMTIFEYSPVQIKLAVTGNGKADKKAVEKMVRLQLHLKTQTTLLDDTIDALATGLTHVTSNRVY